MTKKIGLLLMLLLVLSFGSMGYALKGNKGRVQGREERTEKRGAEGREERRANSRRRVIGREERTERRGLEGRQERSETSRRKFRHKHRHTHLDNGVRRRRRVRRGYRH